MAYTNLSDLLKGICDAIRAKKGTTGEINHQDIPSEITSIEPIVDGCTVKTVEVTSDGTRYLYISESDIDLYVSDVVSGIAKIPQKIEIIRNTIPNEDELYSLSATIHMLITDIMTTNVSESWQSFYYAYFTGNYFRSWVSSGSNKLDISSNVTNGVLDSSYMQPIGWDSEKQKWKFDILIEQSNTDIPFTIKFYYSV